MARGAHPLNDCSLPISILKGGSKFWRHIAQSWKMIARLTIFLSLTCPKDILQLKLWWRKEYHGFYFGITMDRAIVLFGKGLCFFWDIWDPGKNDLLVWEEAQNKILNCSVYCDFWVNLLDCYDSFHMKIINQYEATSTSHVWVSLYKNPTCEMPKRVAYAGYFKEFKFKPVQISIKFMSTLPKSTFEFQYFTLIEVKPNVKNAVPSTALSGWMSCVRMDRLSRGSAQFQFTLFFDPSWWWWPKVTPFLSYLGQAW